MNAFINLSIKFCTLWKQFRIFLYRKYPESFTQEREFSQFLLDLDNGSLNDYSDNIQILDERYIANIDSDMIKDMYEDIILQKQYKIVANSVILSARNTDIDEINEKVVSLLNEITENQRKFI